MFTRKKRRRINRTLVLSGLALAAYFVAVYHPLSKRARELDRPLTDIWRKLAACTLEVQTDSAEDLPRISESLQLVQSSISSLDRAERTIAARVALETAIRTRMEEPFQLFDFQNERQLRAEELDRLAKQQQVKLSPSVAEGFPEYTADMDHPSLLWAQLAFARELVSGAIHCRVASISALKLPPVQTHSSTVTGEEFLDEVPLTIELAGSMASISRFLLSLPARADEGKPAGMPETAPTKPALFIDRILLRKSTPEKPDEVQLNLRVCGFVYRKPV